MNSYKRFLVIGTVALASVFCNGQRAHAQHADVGGIIIGVLDLIEPVLLPLIEPTLYRVGEVIADVLEEGLDEGVALVDKGLNAAADQLVEELGGTPGAASGSSAGPSSNATNASGGGFASPTSPYGSSSSGSSSSSIAPSPLLSGHAGSDSDCSCPEDLPPCRKRDACISYPVPLIRPTDGAYTANGVQSFMGVFSAAAARGVENAMVRAFNATKVCPDCEDGVPHQHSTGTQPGGTRPPRVSPVIDTDSNGYGATSPQVVPMIDTPSEPQTPQGKVEPVIDTPSDEPTVTPILESSPSAEAVIDTPSGAATDPADPPASNTPENDSSASGEAATP